jgi:hypothetical protein
MEFSARLVRTEISDFLIFTKSSSILWPTKYICIPLLAMVTFCGDC